MNIDCDSERENLNKNWVLIFSLCTWNNFLRAQVMRAEFRIRTKEQVRINHQWAMPVLPLWISWPLEGSMNSLETILASSEPRMISRWWNGCRTCTVASHLGHRLSLQVKQRMQRLMTSMRQLSHILWLSFRVRMKSRQMSSRDSSHLSPTSLTRDSHVRFFWAGATTCTAFVDTSTAKEKKGTHSIETSLTPLTLFKCFWFDDRGFLLLLVTICCSTALYPNTSTWTKFPTEFSYESAI